MPISSAHTTCPRGPEDFEGLTEVGDFNYCIHSRSRLSGSSITFVPRLSEEYSVGFHLLDLTRGADTVRTQLRELVSLFAVAECRVVDIGGDIVAFGNEPGLRSPISDGMILAATENIGVPVQVGVAGFGLDGELTESEFKSAQHALEIRNAQVGANVIQQDVASEFRETIKWFPSEATALMCLSALGYRGIAEIRDSGLRVSMSESSPLVYWYEHDSVLRQNKIAEALSETSSLAEAENSLAELGIASEIEYERKKLAGKGLQGEKAVEPPSHQELEGQLRRYSNAVKKEGVSFLTIRRVAELLNLSLAKLHPFISYLEKHAIDQLDLPLWRC